MTRLVIVAGIAAAAVLAVRHLTRPEPPAPPRWLEDEDGIQPPDTYPSGLIASANRTHAGDSP